MSFEQFEHVQIGGESPDFSWFNFHPKKTLGKMNSTQFDGHYAHMISGWVGEKPPTRNKHDNGKTNHLTHMSYENVYISY